MNLLEDARASIEAGSWLAFGLAILFGLVSSIGPCTASRYAALAACETDARVRGRTGVVFLAGVTFAYVIFGLCISALIFLHVAGAYLYLGAGIAFLIIGFRQPFLGEHRPHGLDEVDAKMLTARRRDTLLGVFVLGIFSATIVNPCCAPFLGLVIAEATSRISPYYTAALLGVFGVAHGLPMVWFSQASGWVFDRLSRVPHGREALGVMNGALMVGLGIYYLALT